MSGANGKPKVAFYWCASCGGCEEAVVDLADAILDVVAAVDIVLWPVALDFKRKDVEAMPDGSIAASFINGAVRTSEQEEMAHLLRRKSQVVIAFGACSQLGGIPGLANLHDRRSVLRTSYIDTPSTVNPDATVPQPVLEENGRWVTLPVLYDTVRTLGQVIEVDYTIPGCPPTPQMLAQAVQALLAGSLPEKGSVLAPDRALCEECPRSASRPEKLLLREFRRPWQVLIDEETCLLAQGLVCMGPATRSGCGALCVGGNMPCTGCFGPVSRVEDHGSKILSSIASIVDASAEEDILRILDSLPDPVGTFYRYSLAASRLRRRRGAESRAHEPVHA